MNSVAAADVLPRWEGEWEAAGRTSVQTAVVDSIPFSKLTVPTDDAVFLARLQATPTSPSSPRAAPSAAVN